MKIAIIGGGWVGCHLANKLMDTHKVTIFEKNPKLFQETSYSNQNRLHRGYHYARNSKTRELCEKTFTRFTNDYSFMVSAVHNNAYAIPKESVLDYGTYKKIFYDYHFSEVDLGLDNLQDVILVDERFINFKTANEFFNNKLGNLVVKTEITNAAALKEDFDLVINCTNNSIPDPECKDAFYELAVTLLYDKVGYTPFGALTLVDGEFFSIYPYEGNTFTVSDVKYTPVGQFDKLNDLKIYPFHPVDITYYKEMFESRVMKYYPEFKDKFVYKDYFLATKAKYKNSSADRYPVISQQGNVINCFTGKIQGIYVIEDYVKNEIARR